MLPFLDTMRTGVQEASAILILSELRRRHPSTPHARREMARLIAILLIPIALASSPESSTTMSVREWLADQGLSCCIDTIIRKPTWFRTGGSVDAVTDVRYLTDEMVDALDMPQVKRNILKGLASEEREKAAVRRRQSARDQEGRYAFLYATLDTLFRGFMLGFGTSFIYETLILSRDYYQAEEDLMKRTSRAGLRAAVLGLAVALVMSGGSIFVPNSLRHGWLR